jgi:hypothetical protein
MSTTPQLSSVATARIGIVQTLLVLGLSLCPWPADWERARSVIDSARSPELNRAERDGHDGGYYEDLIGGGDGQEIWPGEPSLRLIGKPGGWVRFQEADVVRYLKGDFLQFELKAHVLRILFGQPFQTNAFGMHDDPVTVAKAPDVFRIAVLGSSMDMGWGVRYQETYLNQLENWLHAHANRVGADRARRFEVLNFAVAAYSPMQRLDTLRRKVMAFQPDLVIYSATTLDIRLTEIHLCDLLRRNVDLKYDFLWEAVDSAGIVQDDVRVDWEGRIINKDRLKSKLRPFYWGLYDVTLAAFAAECRGSGVPLAMVIIPRVGKADAPAVRAEPVARIKAIAAHQGVPVFDLSDTFDRFDPASLEIAAWDDHPNAVGHRRLFLALARAIVNDQELYHLLFGAPAGDATRDRYVAIDFAPSACGDSPPQSPDR